jgi:hypothetical protein
MAFHAVKLATCPISSTSRFTHTNKTSSLQFCIYYFFAALLSIVCYYVENLEEIPKTLSYDATLRVYSIKKFLYCLSNAIFFSVHIHFTNLLATALCSGYWILCAKCPYPLIYLQDLLLTVMQFQFQRLSAFLTLLSSEADPTSSFDWMFYNAECGHLLLTDCKN